MDDGDLLMLLVVYPAWFKDLKPVLLLFSDGRAVSTHRWRLTVLDIL